VWFTAHHEASATACCLALQQQRLPANPLAAQARLADIHRGCYQLVATCMKTDPAALSAAGGVTVDWSRRPGGKPGTKQAEQLLRWPYLTLKGVQMVQLGWAECKPRTVPVTVRQGSSEAASFTGG
jgi:hypothetical protein